MTIQLKDPFFAPRQATAISSTIPSSLERCKETGRLDAFRLRPWTKESGLPYPHIFWDSDVAKVMEGMAYVSKQPGGEAIGKRLEELVKLVVSAQQPDGYLNTHFSVVEKDLRWTNLYDWHELYCAGHLTEAAVAHYHATGSRTFLDAICRYIDYIWTVFGEDGLPGYPGHEELELALCKLYKATGNEKYLKLAKLFIDRRGTKPNFFVEQEGKSPDGLLNRQAHKPVREQSEAVGHAVRAVYLYSGMADVGELSGDDTLIQACERLFNSIAEHKMFITGGIGSTQFGEAFSNNGDLPNDRTYNESCASIGLVLFATRMAAITGDAKYADVAERCMFNGALSGLSLSGDKYFYVNRLECNASSLFLGHSAHERQPWFSTSCCPTNYCRFVPQLGDFCYRAAKDRLTVDVPVAADVTTDDYAVAIESGYPYDGAVTLTIRKGGVFDIAFRIPGWCEGSIALPEGGEIIKGYWHARREWKAGDVLKWTIDMPVTRNYSNAPADAGKVALSRGPLVYCVEAPEDADYAPYELVLPDNASFELVPVDGLLDGTMGIRFTATRKVPAPKLHSTTRPKHETRTVTAIPYALWQNRGPVQMNVYLQDAE